MLQLRKGTYTAEEIDFLADVLMSGVEHMCKKSNKISCKNCHCRNMCKSIGNVIEYSVHLAREIDRK